MQKLLFTLLLALLSLGVAAAERTGSVVAPNSVAAPNHVAATDSVIVTGNVLDAYSRDYLDSVHVELLQPISGEVLTTADIHDSAADITDLEYRKSWEEWNPIVKRRIYSFMAVPGTYILRLSRAGYQEKEQQITIPERRYGRRTETWEVKDVLLNRALSRRLDEAVVIATKIKMYAKGDTVIYNADAFQVADGSMLDGLIAMMPGLEIRDGGKIYQNGEYIPELLLNGKDFFNGDAAIALQNLPAYTIKDLRIYHRAPTDAYLRKDWTHADTLRWGKVLDVRLKKQYSHGWITNAELAAGPPPLTPRTGGTVTSSANGASNTVVSSSPRSGGTRGGELARLFGLHFSDHIRLGVFANINNINDTGTANNQGDWSSSWMPDPGVTTMKLGALDFTVDGKKTKVNYNLNVQAVQETTDSEKEISSTTFLPSGDVYTRSRNTNTFDRFHFVWNNTITWNAKKAHFFFKPGFDFFRRNNDGQSLTAQFNADPMDAYRGAALDSLFSSATDGYLPLYSPHLQQMLVNRTSTLYSSREDFWWEVVRLHTSFNSPITGNHISIDLYQDYKHQTPKQSELYGLWTGATTAQDASLSAYAAPSLSGRAGGEATLQNKYILTPSRSLYSSLEANYTFHEFGKFKSHIYYRYGKTFSKNKRDYYLPPLDPPERGEEITTSDEGLSKAALANPSIDEVTSSPRSGGLRGDVPLRGARGGALPSTTDWQTLAIDADNTFRAESNVDAHRIAPSLIYSGKFSFSIAPTFEYKREYRADTRAVQQDVTRRNALFGLQSNLSFRYRPLGAKPEDKQKGKIGLNYNFGQSAPSISYLLDVRDASNPLRITLGNPDLCNGYSHQVVFSQTYYGSHRNNSSRISFSRRQRQVAQAMTYAPETGVYTYRPENVDGNWDLSGSLYYGFDIPKTKLYLSGNTHANYINSVDLISPDGIADAALSTVHNSSASQSLRLTYREKKITASLSADFGVNHATSDRPGFIDRTTFNYNYATSLYANNFLWGFSFSTSLSLLQRRGYDDASMNDNTLVWDAQFSRSFGKAKAWNLRLKGHDLLRQLSNVQRSINAQGLTETWFNSLPSYLMLHVTYRWNKNPKK